MTLKPGQRFGQYEIAEALGAGGMGEVWRARDAALERDVAIKILPESLAADAGRVARFEQEAKTLAALNHPNIAQIFSIERGDSDAGGAITALVMEIVEGATLEERIAAGPIPADEALGIAMQIASALEAAHGKQIVHRDLKPANVKLKPDGTVKLLDFGIAKALDTRNDEAAARAAYTTPAMTQAGIVLGTAAYMSPEQARGKAIDQRTDIWAFGCLLLEMLTGQPAFGGEDITVTLARILEREADTGSLPAMVSPAVKHTIAMCLVKDPRRRIADIRDVGLALEGAFQADWGGREAAGTQGSADPARWLWPGIAAALAAAAVLGIWAPWRTEALPPEVRLQTLAPFEIEINDDFAISPNGRYLAVATEAENTGGQNRLWLWELDTGEARPLPRTEGAQRPFWSPDSRFIGFGADDSLNKIDIRGGPAQMILGGGVATNLGGAWTSNDRIVFVSDELGLSYIDAEGGQPVVLTKPWGEEAHHELPIVLPDDRHVLYFRHHFIENSGIYIASLDASPENQPQDPIILNGDGAKLVTTGDGEHYLLFSRDGSLLVQAFDAENLTLSGAAAAIVSGAMSGGGNGYLSASRDGRVLVYRPGDVVAPTFELHWVDRNGTSTPVGAPVRAYNSPRISPDGQQIAVGIDEDIWIWSTARNTLSRLTFDNVAEGLPSWTLDGTRIVFASIDGTIKWKSSNGSDEPSYLSETGFGLPAAITRNGHLIYQADRLGGTVIQRIAIDGSGDSEPLLSTDFNYRYIDLSPDERWLAYTSTESGRPEIYVRPYPELSSARWQLSANGGQEPRWSPDGRFIYYLELPPQAGQMMAVPIAAGEDFSSAPPEALFGLDEFALTVDWPSWSYDIAPDGRFLLLRRLLPAGTTAPRDTADLVFVQNWLSGLKNREAAQ